MIAYKSMLPAKTRIEISVNYGLDIFMMTSR